MEGTEVKLPCLSYTLASVVKLSGLLAAPNDNSSRFAKIPFLNLLAASMP